MTIGAGFLYGIGVFSGLVLAALAVLVYLALRTPETIDEAALEESVKRTEALTARLTAATGKIQDASQVARNIEPGE